MGMESFFINLKLVNTVPWSKVSSILNVWNHNVKILPSRKLNLQRKRFSGTLKIVVDKLVLVEYNENDAVISLQACFSCYERARNVMVKIVQELSSDGIVQYVYYGSEVIEKKDFDSLEAYINKFTETKKRNFHTHYGNIQKELLPDEFYRYVIHHKYPYHR